VIPLALGGGTGLRRIVALGAHPDDVEIGCGATLSKLAAANPAMVVDMVLLTGAPHRIDEARHAHTLFLPDTEVVFHHAALPDGRLPQHWDQVKELLEGVARGARHDLVLAPRLDDAHQDHRTVAEIVPTVWRDHLVLNYEIPKYDGDLGRASVYVGLSEDEAREKVLRLHKAYPSQAARDWWDDDVFLGLARLRGMECRAPYAEAFANNKLVVGP
jgi:LmbE family N-acetylglucosaminyl deacetylase